MAVAQEVVLPTGARQPAEQVLDRWVKRRDSAKRARRPYEIDWQENSLFASGIQWTRYIPHAHRVLERKRVPGRSMRTVDVLQQFGKTVIGKLAADDFRPNLLTIKDNREQEVYAEQLNLSFGWGWDEEWRGDQQIMRTLRILWTLGTGAIRCRVDRTQGPVLGQVPHQNGQPMLDPERARAYVAEQQASGQSAGLQPLREARVCWDVLSAWNLLPPPGVEDPREFPWEIIVRPVPLDELRSTYGSKADGVQAESIEQLGLVGMNSGGRDLTQSSAAPSQVTGLTDHALVYTGYCKPTREYPDGERIVWANDEPVLLDYERKLPLQDQPWGARSGVTYFRYDIVTGRFFARAGIEPAKDAQRLRNKRVSQQDEIIDRGLPKVYVEEPIKEKPRGLVMEEVVLGRGNQKPVIDGGVPVGPWMQADIELQDANIEKSLGLHAASLGEPPPGVFPYSYIALLNEQDQVKLGPIADDVRISVADVSRDTIECMKQWGPQKQILLADPDDPDGRLKSFMFNAQQIPAGYKVTPAKKGALPRSQGAELQKISDLWNAAVAIKVADRRWLTWYDDSLKAGKAQDLPLDPTSEQLHKAALENIVMERTGQPLPVADYDDAQVHIPEHREAESQLEQALESGDETAAQPLQALRAHIQMHEQQAQQNALAAVQGPQPGAMSPGQAPQGPSPNPQIPAALAQALTAGNQPG